MPLSIGEEFAGYTVARQLGAGGMGEVYLAQHPRLPRQDALKILPPDLTDDNGFRQRFNREADLAATLWHPHIVGVHDRGEHHGQLWISMDFVDGTDAARLLKETDRHGLPVDDALEIVDALADALDYAHEKGLLHRDVKPANILIATGDKGRRRILLTDFGIARQADEISGLTATNQTIGTVSYASPEQLTGAELDNRSDQYSLAVTAYELLTGATPFQHSNPAVVIGQHLNNPPPPIGAKRPEFAALDAVFARALSKQPADRFATCRDLAAALRMALQAQAGVAQPASGGFAPVDIGSAVPAQTTSDPSATALAPSYASASTGTTRRWWTIGVPVVLAALLAVVAGFAVFETTRSRDTSTPPPPWEPYVAAGTTTAVALTTVNYQSVDQDVQRVLDISTGQFHDDFANRAEPFKQVVRDAQSVSEGTVSGAGLETLDGDRARVLIAITVKTTNANEPQQEPRHWRMRIDIEKTGDTYKASNVEFVS